MIEFIGHFHPLLVHLPVGILLVALWLFVLSGKEKYQALRPAIPVLLLAGACMSLFSCITGYVLSVSDDYDEDLVNTHMWMGIAVTILSFFCYYQFIKPTILFPKKITAIVLLLAVFITGHLGGSLTHGGDYLSKPFLSIFSGDSVSNKTIPPLKNAAEAMVYADVIKPVLQTKCYSCHGAAKQKGGLRMDDSLLLMKGGKNGKIIDLRDVAASELLLRIHMPVDNEHHMPPREKPQLTESQVALMHWWISNGAVFSKKVKELPQTDKIKTILIALEQHVNTDVNPALTLKPVEKADEKIIGALQQKGIIVAPVASNSNYLFASFVTVNHVSADDLKMLGQLKKQMLVLKINNSDLSDSLLPLLAALVNLVKLDVANTKITDAGLPVLKSLSQLQTLNLVGNAISEKGLLPLQAIKTVENIYLYKTNLSAGGYAQLRKSFLKTRIDTGGYTISTLPTDTTTVKYDYNTK